MTDSKEFWNEMWSGMDDTGSGSNELLRAGVEGLPPGRALEIGCGTGGNAVWLAKQGWHVTALDFSDVAVDKARRLAAASGVDIDFVVGDASSHRPEGQFDLIVTFYIQLFPEQRRRMLAWAAKALAQGGTLLFVGHDKSSPPPGWTDEDRLSLTTPDEVVLELPGLRIERAYVHAGVEGGADACVANGDGDEHEHGDLEGSLSSDSTIVRATRGG